MRGSVASAMEIAAPILQDWIRPSPRSRVQLYPPEAPVTKATRFVRSFMAVKFLQSRVLLFKTRLGKVLRRCVAGGHGLVGEVPPTDIR